MYICIYIHTHTHTHTYKHARKHIKYLTRCARYRCHARTEGGSGGESEGDGGGWLCVSDITCSMHGVHPGSFTFSLVDAYIYHEYLKKIFAVDAVCVQRAVTLSRQWTQTASKAAERVKCVNHGIAIGHFCLSS